MRCGRPCSSMTTCCATRSRNAKASYSAIPATVWSPRSPRRGLLSTRRWPSSQSDRRATRCVPKHPGHAQREPCIVLFIGAPASHRRWYRPPSWPVRVRPNTRGMMKTKAAVLWGMNQKWQVEDVELDGPKEAEVLVKLTASGLCHSDYHMV